MTKSIGWEKAADAIKPISVKNRICLFICVSFGLPGADWLNNLFLYSFLHYCPVNAVGISGSATELGFERHYGCERLFCFQWLPGCRVFGTSNKQIIVLFYFLAFIYVPLLPNYNQQKPSDLLNLLLCISDL